MILQTFLTTNPSYTLIIYSIMYAAFYDTETILTPQKQAISAMKTAYFPIPNYGIVVVIQQKQQTL